MLPFSLVDSVEFRKLISDINPKLNVMSRNTLKKQLVQVWPTAKEVIYSGERQANISHNRTVFHATAF